MDLITRASALLGRTEAELKKLLAQAAAAGEYTHIVTLAAWARALHEMVEGEDGGPAASKHGGSDWETASSRAAAHTSSPNRGRAIGSYPRFFRQGDRLVRVAWSKRDKKEYEHRAPLSTIAATCAAISSKGSDGRLFTTEEVLPIYDTDGAVLPSYQAYAVIALLKQLGLLDQHGRRGYSIAKPGELKSAVDAIWRNLPER